MNLRSDQRGRLLYCIKRLVSVSSVDKRNTLHNIEYVVQKQAFKRDILVQTFGVRANTLGTHLWTLHEVLSSSNGESLHPLP